MKRLILVTLAVVLVLSFTGNAMADWLYYPNVHYGIEEVFAVDYTMYGQRSTSYATGYQKLVIEQTSVISWNPYGMDQLETISEHGFTNYSQNGDKEVYIDVTGEGFLASQAKVFLIEGLPAD